MKNRDNFEKIYVEYFDLVYKYLYCLTRNADIAEELAQETFYKAILKIHTFKNQSKISSWLCQIARNLWYNDLKKKQKISVENDEFFEKIISEYNIENDFINNEEKNELINKIKLLDPTMKKVMCLRIYGNFTFKEIAEILRKK